jgi:hypothetical protein
MALMHFMRLSLRKGAHAAVSSAAWQEIRVGMTKGKATLPWRAVAEQQPFFITLGGPLADGSSGRDNNSVAKHLYAITELSSRPERSAVEGPAVSFSGI